jgi:hypothetical protein
MGAKIMGINKEHIINITENIIPSIIIFWPFMIGKILIITKILDVTNPVILFDGLNKTVLDLLRFSCVWFISYDISYY